MRLPTLSRARRITAGVLLAAGVATGSLAYGLEQTAASSDTQTSTVAVAGVTDSDGSTTTGTTTGSSAAGGSTASDDSSGTSSDTSSGSEQAFSGVAPVTASNRQAVTSTRGS